jgi:SOS response regulatory protein OraA/RecX
MKTAEEKIAQAKETALRALAERDLTRKELTDLLMQKRHRAPIIDGALLQLETLGALDDLRVANEHVRVRLEEGVAADLMEAELIERGIEQGMARSVLREQLGDRDESGEALELARHKVRTSPARLAPDAIKRRTFAFLARKGYDEEIAREAVERAAAEYLGRP